ncbi:MAG: ABC transporter permease [Pseudomonadales bacterium]|nr:ABC transporter permease [Pseudomonadales bacterium]
MQILSDLSYSLRLLRKTPLFTGITLLIIVLGLSLYTTAYTVEQILTDKPMPYPDGGRYVALKTVYENSGNERGLNNHSEYSYRYIEANSESFSSLHAYTMSSYVLSDGEYARTFSGAALEWEFLQTAAVTPILGRTFNQADAVPGAEKVVLIGESVWESYYNSDPNIVGHTSRIDGEPATIIGVLPSSFQFPIWEEVWVPLSISATPAPPDGSVFDTSSAISLVGILDSGVDLEGASNELEAVVSQLASAFPETFGDRSEYLAPYTSVNQDRGFNLGRIISFVTLVVLALSVINLSSLLFIRSRGRQHELAVRSSVGASGRELAKQVLLESFIICFAGFLLSLLLSVALNEALNYLFVNSMGLLPFWFVMSLQTEAVAVCLFFTVVIWLAAGLPMAIHAHRNQTAVLLSSSNKGTQSSGHNFTAKVVVAAEVVLSFFLLVCCGATIYLAALVLDVEFDLDTERHMVASFNLNSPDYSAEAERVRYIQSLIERVQEIPEVTLAAVSTAPPGKFGLAANYELEDRDLAFNDQLPTLRSIWISDSYFNSLNIELRSGREFTGSDTGNSTSVTVIQQNLADTLWPGDSALGKRIGVTRQGETEWLTVVGVVSNVLQSSFNLSEIPPSIYRPISQSTPTNYYLVAQFQTDISAADLERQLRVATGNVDRNIAVDNFRLLQREIEISQSGLDVLEPIFLTLSFATLILAGIGIYGVIARSITLRRHEIGVRRAVGSADYAIVLRFLRQGAAFLLIGAVVGGAAATLAITGVVSSLSSNASYSAFLPTTFLAVILLMGALIFLACYVPAKKAINLEPGDALRYE